MTFELKLKKGNLVGCLRFFFRRDATTTFCRAVSRPFISIRLHRTLFVLYSVWPIERYVDARHAKKTLPAGSERQSLMARGDEIEARSTRARRRRNPREISKSTFC